MTRVLLSQPVKVGIQKKHVKIPSPGRNPIVQHSTRLYNVRSPSDVSWFRFAPVTIVIRCYLRTINHSDIGVMFTNWTLSNGGLTLYHKPTCTVENAGSARRCKWSTGAGRNWLNLERMGETQRPRSPDMILDRGNVEAHDPKIIVVYF